MPIAAKKNEKTEAAAPTVTESQIDAMTPPQLRKAVKDAGGDPKALGNSDADQMRAYLKEHHGLVKKPAKGKAKPETKTPPAEKVEDKKEEKTDTKPAESKTATSVDQEEFWKKLPPAFRSYLEAQELRITTLESAVGISNGRSSVPSANAADEYAPIRQFIKPVLENGKPKLDGEGNPVEELDMSADDIQKASKDQLILVAQIMGLEHDKMKKMEVREIRPLIATQFANTPTTEEPKKAASAPFGGKKTETAPAPAGESYEPGHVVKVNYENEVWDPCLLMTKETTKKRGVATDTFTVFFNKDGTWVENIPASDIAGKSKKKMTENPADCGWEGEVPEIKA